MRREDTQLHGRGDTSGLYFRKKIGKLKRDCPEESDTQTHKHICISLYTSVILEEVYYRLKLRFSWENLRKSQ